MADQKGFDVEMGNANEELDTSDPRAAAHQAVDRLMDRMQADASKHYGARGGNIDLEIDHITHKHTIRVIVADVTGMRDCVWCNGTGVEGS